MSNSDNEGCMGLIIIIGTTAISIFTGIMAWNWVKPESFGGALVFLIAWSLLSYIGHLVIVGIAALLFSK